MGALIPGGLVGKTRDIMSASKTNQHLSSPPPPVFVSIMNDVPGYRIIQVLGAVYGQTTLTRSLGHKISAGIKALAGGEVNEFTGMISDARESVLERKILECSNRHGNAVMAM
jgi:uncharacterized protein YbjQ (UPF0145 family)